MPIPAWAQLAVRCRHRDQKCWRIERRRKSEHLCFHSWRIEVDVLPLGGVWPSRPHIHGLSLQGGL
jgi:hypothetical protein